MVEVRVGCWLSCKLHTGGPQTSSSNACVVSNTWVWVADAAWHGAGQYSAAMC